MASALEPAPVALASPLPMCRPAADPDAWHAVASPGGYEWWYFDAESDDGRTQIAAIFLDGFVFHPEYLRRYGRFLRRPTRVRPPLAADYPCVYFVVYREGRIAAQFMTQFQPGGLAASAERPFVTVGPNRIERVVEGVYQLELAGTPWHLTARGPQLRSGETFAGRFEFRPLLQHAPMSRRFLSRDMTGADHHWILAAPRCDVVGHFEIGDGGRSNFAGRGYHDHNFGTGPIGPGVARWIWGRMLTDEGAISFHLARPRGRPPGRPPGNGTADETHLIRADASGIVEVATSARMDWSRRTGWLLSYPNSIDFGDVLRLSNARLIDSAPFYMRLIYDARSGRHTGSALCEVAYPNRLRRPLLGRMIEMSIDKRSATPCPGSGEGRVVVE